MGAVVVQAVRVNVDQYMREHLNLLSLLALQFEQGFPLSHRIFRDRHESHLDRQGTATLSGRGSTYRTFGGASIERHVHIVPIIHGSYCCIATQAIPRVPEREGIVLQTDMPGLTVR